MPAFEGENLGQLLTAILHWPQAQALFGLGPEAADFALRGKAPPGLRELVPPAAAFILLALLPYAEEFWRGWREKR